MNLKTVHTHIDYGGDMKAALCFSSNPGRFNSSLNKNVEKSTAPQLLRDAKQEK